MTNFNFIIGQWYKFYYIDRSTKVARYLTINNGVIMFQIQDNGEVPYDVMLRDCIHMEQIHESL